MKRSSIYVTFLIAGAFFMENLDGTIIATALPQMARSFHIGAVNLNIGMSAYLLTLAVFIPISGWVADRLGSRTVFTSAIAIFTLSSVVCGFCHTLTQFTIMRIIQGLGGAMMVPVGRLIVIRNTPRPELAKAITYITWPGLTALVLGPPIGGFITTYWGWRWIFFLNLPLGVIALILALLWIENIRAGERHPFDWLTFILAGVASSGTVFAMEKLGGEGIGWQLPTAVLGISIICGILAVFAARRKPATSFVDLESMKTKTYALSVYGASSFRLAAAVLPFLLPLMFQIVFGLSAFRSGLYLIGLFLGDFSMKSMVIQFLRRFGFRRILIVNGILVAATMMCCCFISQATPLILILTILFIHGASRSMQFTCMTTIAYSEIPAPRMSRANGFLSAVMQLSLGMGIAGGAITLRIIAHAHGHSAAVPQLRDFHEAIFVMSLLALGPVINSLGLSPDAGSAISGHRTPELNANPT